MNAADGGSAFPTHDFHKRVDGMTLRDYFAAKALVALVNGYVVMGHLVEPHADATRAYQIADAMLAARKGNTP